MRRVRPVRFFWALVRDLVRECRAGGAVYTTAKTKRYGETGGAGESLPVRRMRVVEVVRETADVVSLFLEPADGKGFSFRAGQFLTVVVRIGGKTYRRAYSLSTAPCSPGPFAITVKRLSGGRVSGYLHEAVSAGDFLEILGPSGTFVTEGEDGGALHHVFVAAGVGITPVISMAESLMMADRKHRVTILYGNRGVEDIVFRERLSRLSRRYRNFRVRHSLTTPPPRWRGGRGRLTGEKVAAFLGTISPDQRFYLCGPEGMMEDVATFLRERGVSHDRIRIERFVRPRGVGSLPDEARHPIHFLRSGRRILSRPGVSLLESGLAAGVALPFSCTMGGCGACRTRLRKGSVRMAEPNGLSEAEQEEGYILLCVAEARSEVELDA